jgi:hypothetical protein
MTERNIFIAALQKEEPARHRPGARSARREGLPSSYRKPPPGTGDPR